MAVKPPPSEVENSPAVKDAVRSFYNEIGWQRIQEGMYQNATYEDLRPVSQEYIHRCHLRVLRHLKPEGRFLLDAGSGPIQYPEYLEYSRNYARRVCVDLSEVALREARQRIGGHGLFVVADIANMPFRDRCFDGIVSLHTIHHLPDDEHVKAFREMYRVLAPGAQAVIVDGWRNPLLMRFFKPLIQGYHWVLKKRRRKSSEPETLGAQSERTAASKLAVARGTFVRKYNAAWLKREVGRWMPVAIFCWRSVSVQFLRAIIHPQFGGRWILRLIYWLEERFPHFLGEIGQYPLIVVRRVD